MAIADFVELLRERVVRIAQEEYLAGSHYIKGGYGHLFDDQRNVNGSTVVPGNQRPSWVWMGADRVNTHDVPVCFAADSNRPAPIGPRVCGGRCEDPRIGALTSARDQLGSASSANDVLAVASRCRNPRSFRWPRPANEPDSNREVLGECCVGKRHFDCIGFVNWCFWRALRGSSAISYEIEQWQRPISAARQFDRAAIDAGRILPGDILYGHNSTHIGLVATTTEVIHAAGWNVGVQRERIRTSIWHGGANTGPFLACKARQMGELARAQVQSIEELDDAIETAEALLSAN